MNASALVRYYDTHPINEQEILAKLGERGIDPSRLTERELKEFDQDHYGGTEAVDALAALAGIRASDHVLDICSGMGGPARWLAFTVGCTVTGLDLTASRVESARRLTALVKLDAKVSYVHGDACAMPFADASFDAAIGQEAWVHVPDKQTLLRQAYRVLKPGGVIAFTDIIERAPLDADEARKMADEMQFPVIASVAGYRAMLAEAGFRIERQDDLSAPWTEILQHRLQMYRSLRATTVARFGQAHHEYWDQMYTAFVGLYTKAKLGGARFVARR